MFVLVVLLLLMIIIIIIGGQDHQRERKRQHLEEHSDRATPASGNGPSIRWGLAFKWGKPFVEAARSATPESPL